LGKNCGAIIRKGCGRVVKKKKLVPTFKKRWKPLSLCLKKNFLLKFIMKYLKISCVALPVVCPEFFSFREYGFVYTFVGNGVKMS